MRLRIIWVLCISLLAAGSLHAATVTFSGAVNELWSNPDNWDALPGVDDKARVRSGDTPCILDYDAGIISQYVGESSDVGRLILVDGAQLAVRTWNIIGYSGGEPDNRHTIEVLGGVLNGGHPDYSQEGRFYIGRQGYGHLIIDRSGEVNMLFQELGIGNDTNGDGIVELRGGTLNLTDNGDWPLRIAYGTNAKGKLDISGGVLRQRFSDGRLTYINDYIADGLITAYDGVGTVLVETVDGQIIVKGLHPMNPMPEDGVAITPGDLELNWTVEPGTQVDVWFDTSADLSTAQLVVDRQAVTSVAVKVDPKQRYYWAVDTYAPGAEDPNYGWVFDFLVDNLPPVVRAADDVTTWLVDGSRELAISATVDDSDPTTTVWTVVSEPNEGTAVIADAAQLDTTVTLTEIGTYVLQIEASDGEYSDSDTVTINVFANSCLAAQSLPDYVPIPGDLNLDCVVDQADIDLLLEQWLNCNGLDCPEIDPVDPNLP